MRQVMIGTPCYDGRLDVWYTNSLINTIRLSEEKQVHIIPIWVSFDALIQRARNDTIAMAIELGIDDLIWIDSDIEWEPEWFYKLLDYPFDVVGGTYRKKGDKEEYVVRKLSKPDYDVNTGLMEVDGLGTGFVKMSRPAMQYLWDTSTSYIDPKDSKERKMIFDCLIENGDLISEDITAFKKLLKGGFKIYLDTNMTCNHVGPYKFKGNFQQWHKNGYKVEPTLPAVPQKIESTPNSAFRIPIKKQL